MYGPRGVVAAINYPVLQDVVLPQFFEMVEDTGLLDQYHKQEKRAKLTNGAEILFRSMDKPDWIRGVELSWFFIDEGRHLTRSAWDILVGRLRQKGYTHSGWVCSTPNGYDWMYDLFHDNSDLRLENAHWFGAPTRENSRNLDEDYMADLENNFHGRWYEQEVLGHFVGVMSGAVFPQWDPAIHTRDVKYDPKLPLYSFWDFGIGDLGVVLFAQIDHEEHRLPSGGIEYSKVLKFIGVLEGKDRNAADWAREWKNWLDRNTGGRRPNMNIGDPAGRARQTATGTSVIEALTAEGVPMVPAPKKPPDYSIRILANMMAGDKVLVDRETCSVLSRALSGYHFKVDDAGNKTGTMPIHDWTSHYADAARYGAAQLLSYYPSRSSAPARPRPGPGTMGYVIGQIEDNDTADRLIGHEEPVVTLF